MVKVTVYDQRVMDQRMVGWTNGPEVVVVVVVIVVVVVVAIFFHHHHCSSGEIRNLFTFVNVLIILFVYIISYSVKVAVIFVAAAMVAGMAKVVS